MGTIFVFNYGFNSFEDEYDVIEASLVNCKSPHTDRLHEVYGATYPDDIKALGYCDIPFRYHHDLEYKFEGSDIWNKLQSLTSDDFIIGFDYDYIITSLKSRYPNFKIKAKFISFKNIISNVLPTATTVKLRNILQYYPEANQFYETQLNFLELPVRKIEADVFIMSAIFNSLKELYDFDKLLAYADNPIVNYFTFGKYKGRLISDICKSDIGYIKWFIDSIGSNIGSSKDPERDKALIETIKQNLTKIYGEDDHE